MPTGKPCQPISLAKISQHVGGRLIGDPHTQVSGVSSLEEAGPHDIVFVTSDRFLSQARQTRAAALLVHHQIDRVTAPQIVVDHPAQAFARMVQEFFVPRVPPRGIAVQIIRGEDVTIGEGCSIWPFVTLGDRVTIGSGVTIYPGVFIGDDCVVGDQVVLYSNVTLREGTTLGNRVIVHSGTVIGSDGFGYIQHQGRHWKIPQIGTVTIEDDVELGANVAVDRATFGQTVIKRGTKVDNLVQIAHNVKVGEDSILVAQVGIAGSTTIGHHVMVGGQVGIADHLTIGDQAMIAAGSGVHKNVEGGQIVSGSPALPHETSLKAHVVFAHLPELRQHIRNLEHRLQQLETSPSLNKRNKKPLKKK